ncbi:uncharacterized protein EI90DRAFT_2811353, partial [Cantharellus anzutake]|uniref:uncharacterized protein n=1 Tax=Cantharellus anzutake TaxID=1750568 RepID=UPI00190654CA
WLIKLGYQISLLKKGVYMDGHEQDDVVKYRNEVFLPGMKELEPCMTYNGSSLECKEPVLKEGERCIIPIWHDESCFHTNKFRRKLKRHQGRHLHRPYSHGCLIHVLDFINEETGWLVIHNEDGSISEGNDAWKIIYPGTNGDPWWDTKQLLEQICTQAIPVFERAHPNCQALFIFNQSSAHASLGPKA